MPVVVENLVTATPQDHEDLHKIYSDAPDWLFTPFSGRKALIEHCLGDGTLLAGRFNDRLLGAARLQQEDAIWYLSHLCVRALTRHRGVAERLIAEARRQVAEAGGELRLRAPFGHLEAHALSARLHLVLDPL
jgi:ribosomal protein S18 acetylase RimI-like enzyme